MDENQQECVIKWADVTVGSIIKVEKDEVKFV